MNKAKWHFFVDRGGTFTDVVAKSPSGNYFIRKLLSEGPYPDATVEAMREILVEEEGGFSQERIATVKMGTTVATNALLEKEGAPTLFLTTEGFKDLLEIRYQNRPEIFALNIVKSAPIYSQVEQIKERIDAAGQVVVPLDLQGVHTCLEEAFSKGMRALAVALMHSYQNPAHEKAIESLAYEVGFDYVSLSHQMCPLPKIVLRADTAVIDAYVTPKLKSYTQMLAKEIEEKKLFFMQSNGGLVQACELKGKDSLLSGPAGGVVAAAKIAKRVGYQQVVTFDMGGTSTDVSLYQGDFERVMENSVGGAELFVPMLNIHTIASGGGSIIRFQSGAFKVGPSSAGANPGPACYRQGGPLTLTDCNLLLGRIQSRYFPKLFGEEKKEPVDCEVVERRFQELAEEVSKEYGRPFTKEEVASGFLEVACDRMANAIKKVSLKRGVDSTECLLLSFGGASGQFACQIADALEMKAILVHPFVGVLSAYGIGLARRRSFFHQSIKLPLTEGLLRELSFTALEKKGRVAMEAQGVEAVESVRKLILCYRDSDAKLLIKEGPISTIITTFEEEHKRRFGFTRERSELFLEALELECLAEEEEEALMVTPPAKGSLEPADYVQLEGKEVPLYYRSDLMQTATLKGPCLIAEEGGTTVVDAGWKAEINAFGDLLLTRQKPKKQGSWTSTQCQPNLLELFNHKLMTIAELMGETLKLCAYSVNVKERLDFSCALFDNKGRLLANAPHVPVHLGSMQESVQAVMRKKGKEIRPDSMYLLNNPYDGGTHLPDLTVIAPLFFSGEAPSFFVASRAHHADIGGITPGSLPPFSHTVEEEGVLFTHFPLVVDGKICEDDLKQKLLNAPYPVRNLEQNLNDIKAQIAANYVGLRELEKMMQTMGGEVVSAYVRHVQENAERCVKEALSSLKEGSFSLQMDNGSILQVAISIDSKKRRAVIDFTGTTAQREDNFNAPFAVCRACVLYLFRTLVKEEIPLNAGAFKPLQLIVPDHSMLKPTYPAAVVAGNVETSQAIVNTLLGALNVAAASQGTMNNIAFGNARYQYYETLCGGAGAGPDFDGASAVHTHMTNSRMTDPELLEARFPVRVEEMSVRRGSGGTGKRAGGEGIKRTLCFLEPMTVTFLTNSRKVAPFGLKGGGDGALGQNLFIKRSGDQIELPSTACIDVEPGDKISILTPGGGGFGKARKALNFTFGFLGRNLIS